MVDAPHALSIKERTMGLKVVAAGAILLFVV
jgi:hypothetical protein